MYCFHHDEGGFMQVNCLAITFGLFVLLHIMRMRSESLHFGQAGIREAHTGDFHRCLSIRF